MAVTNETFCVGLDINICGKHFAVVRIVIPVYSNICKTVHSKTLLHFVYVLFAFSGCYWS